MNPTSDQIAKHPTQILSPSESQYRMFTGKWIFPRPYFYRYDFLCLFWDIFGISCWNPRKVWIPIITPVFYPDLKEILCLWSLHLSESTKYPGDVHRWLLIQVEMANHSNLAQSSIFESSNSSYIFVFRWFVVRVLLIVVTPGDNRYYMIPLSKN